MGGGMNRLSLGPIIAMPLLVSGFLTGTAVAGPSEEALVTAATAGAHGYMGAWRFRRPAAFVFHHTGDRERSAAVVQRRLASRRLGVQYVMDRRGRITRTGGRGVVGSFTFYRDGVQVQDYRATMLLVWK